MGEGAGVIILEELEFARRRGAPIYAELVGYGMSADAYHITAPSEDGDGGMRVMTIGARRRRRRAGRRSTTSTRHGTSTPYNDKLETLAIKRLFGEHAAKLAISSTKSMTGHLLGAAGGLEAGITALAIKHQVAPPTINYETPDPECDLDYVPNTKRPMNDRRTRCRTRSASAAPTARCCSRSSNELASSQLEAIVSHRRQVPRRLRELAVALCGWSWMKLMKIAVCIKQVVTREWQLRVNDQKTWIRDAGRQLRAERAGCLRARRGAAAQGEARRRGGRLLGRAGARARR